MLLGETLDPTWPDFRKALWHEREACRMLNIPNCDEIFQDQFELEVSTRTELELI